MFVFPWLKYRLIRPSHGRDFLFQFTVRPDQFWQLTATYKQELKPVDGIDPANLPLRSCILQNKSSELLRILTFPNPCNSRMEWLLLHSQGPQHGFMGMTGMAYSNSGFSAGSGICFFETDGYDIRIYSFEPDLLYGFSLPAFNGPGLHY